MKRVLVTLGISTMMTFTAFAQNATPQPADNPNAPVITFEKTTHDYGTVTKGGDGTCEFKFKNNGIEPLILSNVSSSCGCTVPEYPKEPVKPGETASIHVTFNSAGKSNEQMKSVTMVCNTITRSEMLYLKGFVKPKD